MRPNLGALAAAGAMLAGAASSAAPLVNVPQTHQTSPYPGITLNRTLTYRTYLVTAHTFQQWASQISHAPIHSEDGQSAAGLAQSAFGYDGGILEQDGACYPSDLVFTHRIEVTLPDVRIGNLTPREEMAVKMASDFIANHEQLHVADYIASADRLIQHAHQMAGKIDCQAYIAALTEAHLAEVDWVKARSQYVDTHSTWSYMTSEINKRLQEVEANDQPSASR